MAKLFGLIMIILLGCSTWKPNASFTGKVVDVKTVGKQHFEVKLDTGADTVTAYMVRFQRPRVGDRFKVQYDSACSDQGRKAIIHKLK